MKKWILLLIVAFFIVACEENKKNAENKTSETPQTEEIHKELYGIWIGNIVDEDIDEVENSENYVPDKLNLIIKQITKESVVAQSILAGVTKTLNGKLLEDGSKVTLILEELGNKKDDGRYEITVLGDTLSGVWTAVNNNNLPKQKYKLAKKDFVYNASLMLPSMEKYVDWYTKYKMIVKSDTLENGKIDTLGINPFYRSASDKIFKINASTQKLTEKDLKNLRKLDLQIIKNTVYARHGYIFKKPTYRNLFNPVDWYIPLFDDVEKEITPIEKSNVILLNRFIKYAEDNYDTFGR